LASSVALTGERPEIPQELQSLTNPASLIATAIATARQPARAIQGNEVQSANDGLRQQHGKA